MTKQRPYAAYTPAELAPVIAKATTAQLKKMRKELAEVGYSKTGITSMRIANREAELAGKEPPHVIPSGKGLPTIQGKLQPGG